MKLKQLLILIFLLLSTGILNAQYRLTTPGEKQTKPIAIINATAHIGNGKVIENAILTFSNGKIEDISSANDIILDLAEYEVIQAAGKHVYPGLILPATNLGLIEISRVRATRDFFEVGKINPHVRSLIAFNTESDIIPTLRFNGILLAQIMPMGQLVCGTSSVVQLDAWNWEDAAYRADDGVCINWPKRFSSPGRWTSSQRVKKNKKYQKDVEMLHTLFQDAWSYKHAAKKGKNLKLEALVPLFDGEKTLFIKADAAKEIMAAVNFAKKFKLPKIAIIGAQDAWHVKDFLKENSVPVILANVHRLPRYSHEDLDMPYKLAGLLYKAGISVCLGYDGFYSARNLPFFAGTTAAYGLNREEALQLITLNAAKILGIDHKTGTLEKGKDANILISAGDILDMRTNSIEYAFIQGRKVELHGKQQALYKKYRDKYLKK